MDPEDALRLEFMKDAGLAVYQSRASMWQALQGAAVAALPLSVVAAYAGQLSFPDLWIVLQVSAAVALACVVALEVNRRSMGRDMRSILDRIKRKTPGP